MLSSHVRIKLEESCSPSFFQFFQSHKLVLYFAMDKYRRRPLHMDVLESLTSLQLLTWMLPLWFPLSLLALLDRKSTRLNSSHVSISYAVFCLKKKTNQTSN